MSAIQSLHDNLSKAFGLPSSAVEWLLMIYQAIQVFDDVADGDEVTRQELDKTIWNMIVAMHQNKFWRLNQDALSHCCQLWCSSGRRLMWSSEKARQMLSLLSGVLVTMIWLLPPSRFAMGQRLL